MKFDGIFSKKYVPSAKILYTVDLSNITSNYLCVDSSNYLCHFWSHKSFFTTQLLYIFLTQILLSTKVQIFRFSTAQVNVYQIPHVIFQIKSQFFFRVWIFFSVMRDNSSVLFRMKICVLLAKVVHQSANFQTCHCSH